MAEEKKFQVEVVTPDGKAVSGQFIGAVVPLVDGLMGFLPGRAPLIAMMGAGMLVLKETKDAVKNYFVAGGFAHMAAGRLTILAEECAPAGKLDPTQANVLLEQAKAMPVETPAQRERRAQATVVAQARLRAAETNL